MNGNYTKENCIWIPLSQQMWNIQKRKSASGVTGVYRYKNTSKKVWRAMIRYKRKIIQLGSFERKEEAETAYKTAYEKRKQGLL